MMVEAFAQFREGLHALGRQILEALFSPFVAAVERLLRSK